MLKKISIAIIAIVAIIGIFGNNVRADEKKNYLEIVKEASEVKYLENEQGYITKKITQANRDTGEVIVELKLANTSEKVEQVVNKGNGKNSEIFLIVDESGSMYDKLENGKSRRQTVRDSSKVLVKSILEKYENVKIGVIKFADKVQVTSELTDNTEQLNTAIDTYTGGSTDLYSALVVAQNKYSEKDVNKLAIILTDGMPNSAKNYKEEFGKTMTVAEATKEKLIKLQNSGINIVTMMTENSDSKSIEKIFGTPENPTVGKYYYISDANISEVIENNIYSDIVDQIHVKNSPIDDALIVDYFPGDILENFEFSYVDNSQNTKVTEGIDEQTKTISWDIGKLDGDEEVSLKYKLKLKDMNNQELLDKEIATNEKVVLTYKDKDEKEYTVTLESSPKVKLTKEKDIVKEEDKGNNKIDDTLAKDPIPQTGDSIIIISAIGLILMVTAISIIQFKKNNYK